MKRPEEIKSEGSIRTGFVPQEKPEEEMVTSGFLFQLTFLSTILFVFSALLLRFIIILLTAILLKIQSVHFRYRLFDIRFSADDSTRWPLGRILLVFGLAYLLFSIAGIFLAVSLRSLRNVRWKTRLFLSWSALFLTFTLPAGIIAGVLFYNDLGIAFQWMSDNIVSRSITGLFMIVVMGLLRPYWTSMFLRTSPRRTLVRDEVNQEMYIRNVFLKSWIGGCVILLFFWLPFNDGFWPVFCLSFGFVVLPLFNQRVAFKKIHIRRSEKKIFATRYSFAIILALIILVRVAAMFTINF